MSTYNIQITEPAENDLYEIGVYIFKELLELETAKRVVSKIAKGIINLEDMPLRNVLAKFIIDKTITGNFKTLFFSCTNSIKFVAKPPH